MKPMQLTGYAYCPYCKEKVNLDNCISVFYPKTDDVPVPFVGVGHTCGTQLLSVVTEDRKIIITSCFNECFEMHNVTWV